MQTFFLQICKLGLATTPSFECKLWNLVCGFPVFVFHVCRFSTHVYTKYVVLRCCRPYMRFLQTCFAQLSLQKLWKILLQSLTLFDYASLQTWVLTIRRFVMWFCKGWAFFYTRKRTRNNVFLENLNVVVLSDVCNFVFAHLRTQNLGCVYCKLGVHLLQSLTCTRFMLVCKFAKLLVCLQLVVLQLRIVITLICKQISAGLVANVVFANSALHVCKQVVQASHFGLRFFDVFLFVQTWFVRVYL